MPNFAHRLTVQNDISSDDIFPGKYVFDAHAQKDLVKHVFETIDPDFHKKIKQGDFLVAGECFGSGSTREDAALVLRSTGIGAVIAKSFSRIFYRNALNVGLSLVECDTKFLDDMDDVELDLDRSVIRNLTKGINIDIKPVPKIMIEFLRKGGVLQYVKDNKAFPGNA